MSGRTARATQSLSQTGQRPGERKVPAAFAERFPSKMRVPVRYNPDRPTVSTVLLEDVSVLLAGL